MMVQIFGFMGFGFSNIWLVDDYIDHKINDASN